MSKHGHQPQSTLNHAAEQTRNDQHARCCGSAKPPHDAIAHRAYDIYVKTGSKQGHCTQNWHQAETELQTADQRP